MNRNMRSMRLKECRKIFWFSQPQEHDYPAAESYLSLIYSPKKARKIVKAFRGVSLSHFKAKDIFRASGLSLLGISNSHVESDREKIRLGQKISPLLLVRDRKSRKVIIADGYHRLCAVYAQDEDAVIPCRIV